MEQDKNESTLSYTKIDDDTHDDSINTLEKTAKKVANVISKSLGSGAKAAEKKALEAQDLIDAKLAEIDDDTHDDSINTLEKTAKKVSNVISKSLGSGAKAAEKKALEAQDLIDAKQVGTEEQLATKFSKAT
jgi:ribosomal protein L22